MLILTGEEQIILASLKDSKVYYDNKKANEHYKMNICNFIFQPARLAIFPIPSYLPVMHVM